ncbi:MULTISPECIES: DUF5056 domain-containing protein [unclassified Marinimicrobium]|jgi:hypothetical protein|uniref:DUF5056 domain-containing protein n=1 Tax=Marinimicrobium TaxID=359337 RepID=UPI000C4F1DE2|nr:MULTISPECIES: hypothetical protein [unclassified Marinimicrobium]MAN52679.1 hypothetical protein [Marinimicrobium sp.]
MKSDIPNDERELDAWLSQTLQRNSDHIDDAGFTDAVMHRLPVRRAGRLSRVLWVLLMAGLAGLLALVLIPAPTWAYALAGAMLATPLTVVIQVGLLATAVLVAGASYWVWQED